MKIINIYKGEKPFVAKDKCNSSSNIINTCLLYTSDAADDMQWEWNKETKLTLIALVIGIIAGAILTLLMKYLKGTL